MACLHSRSTLIFDCTRANVMPDRSFSPIVQYSRCPGLEPVCDRRTRRWFRFPRVMILGRPVAVHGGSLATALTAWRPALPERMLYRRRCEPPSSAGVPATAILGSLWVGVTSAGHRPSMPAAAPAQGMPRTLQMRCQIPMSLPVRGARHDSPALIA